jgi:hypothetical protein
LNEKYHLVLSQSPISSPPPPCPHPPPPLDLLMRCLRLTARRHLLSTSPPGCLLFAGWLSCRILSRRHLASPFVAPPSQVSILYPRLHLHRLVVALHLVALPPPPILSSTLPPLNAPPPHVSRSPLVRPNWLLGCASSASPPPPPLVASCSRPPWLVVVFRCRFTAAIIYSVAAFG